MSDFKQMCAAFFDELKGISKEALVSSSPFTDATSEFYMGSEEQQDHSRKEREKDLDTHYDRPFSSLLTQDEEPTEEANPNTFDLEEPEVVVRSGS